MRLRVSSGTGHAASSLAGVADDFRRAPLVYSRDPREFAPRFSAAVLTPAYVKFFLADSASVDEFLEHLAAETTAYLDRGGERGYE